MNKIKDKAGNLYNVVKYYPDFILAADDETGEFVKFNYDEVTLVYN